MLVSVLASSIGLDSNCDERCPIYHPAALYCSSSSDNFLANLSFIDEVTTELPVIVIFLLIPYFLELATNCSNSNRLKDIGSESGVNTYLIETADDMLTEWFSNVESVGITSGASTPDELVKEVIDKISTFREIEIEKQKGKEENVVFKLPKELVNYHMVS